MKTLVAIVAVCSCLGSLSARAETYVILGVGSKSCGTWTQVRHGRKNLGVAAYQNWVTGFLTAANKSQTNDILKDADADALWTWVDNYCRTHPLDTISTAESRRGSLIDAAAAENEWSGSLGPGGFKRKFVCRP